jgi:uncharacterized membrane protein
MSIDHEASPPEALDDDRAALETAGESAETPERTFGTAVDSVLDWFADNWTHVLVGVAIFWYFWTFARLTIEVHQGYGTSAFDIGVFDQGTWLLSQFKNPEVTITGRNLFGDHTSYILFFVAPLYWIFPKPETLLVVQALVMALGAVPIYLVGLKRLGGPMAAVMAITYLLHPALAASNMENYHPDSFMALFVALALYAAIEDKRRLFVVSIVLCLLVKEDAILIVLPICAWYAWRRHRLLGAVLAIASGLYTLLAFRVIRSFNHGIDLQSGARIPFGGKVSGVIKTAYQRPGEFLDYLRDDERRLFYVWQMLMPLAFIFLISPEVAAVGIFVLAWNVISTFPYQFQIGYHYVQVLVPALSMGTVWAISRLKTRKKQRIAVAIVAVSTLWAAYLWSPWSWSRNGEPGHWTKENPNVVATEAIRKQLPDDAVVSAYHSIVPHIGHRERVYMWPVPWRAAYWGQLNQEGQTLPFTGEIEYLLIPTTLLPDDQPIFDEIKDEFEVVASNEATTLYKRVKPPSQ